MGAGGPARPPDLQRLLGPARRCAGNTRRVRWITTFTCAGSAPWSAPARRSGQSELESLAPGSMPGALRQLVALGNLNLRQAIREIFKTGRRAEPPLEIVGTDELSRSLGVPLLCFRIFGIKFMVAETDERREALLQFSDWLYGTIDKSEPESETEPLPIPRLDPEAALEVLEFEFRELMGDPTAPTPFEAEVLAAIDQLRWRWQQRPVVDLCNVVDPDRIWAEAVGVPAHVAIRALDGDDEPRIYLCDRDRGTFVRSPALTLVFRRPA